MRVERLVSELLGEDISPSSGGGWQTQGGARIFIKRGDGAALAAEAEGLDLLRAAGGCLVPEVLALDQTSGLLVTDFILRGDATPGFQESLGRGLAAVHRQRGQNFGHARDNFIGATPQPNTPHHDWPTFFREQRLGFQMELLRSRGRATLRLERAMEGALSRLSEHLGHGPSPSLLHGDLWNGNAMADRRGRAVIYDPAVYYGDREADLAMTELFGGFGEHFMASYHESWPIEPGYPGRRDLYNLYHVLNHANLFGGSYVSQALSIAVRYA